MKCEHEGKARSGGMFGSSHDYDCVKQARYRSPKGVIYCAQHKTADCVPLEDYLKSLKLNKII